MRISLYPDQKNWPPLLQRPVIDASELQAKVRTILSEVKTEGDAALRRYTEKFDRVRLDQLELSEEAWQDSASRLSPELKSAIATAVRNITRFHETQLNEAAVVETMPGVQCWRRSVGIEKVGLYIPGGTAPLFSTVLMLAIPARLAGCREIILCTPPGPDQSVHPAILYAAREAGVHRVFRVGGVQAIGAMAYGTETVPAVYKIFGPGNQYVNCAKQLIQLDGIPIDMPAGPSEVCVVADETADPAFVAADLLSQAEHGADSQVLLLSPNESIVTAVLSELEKQLALLPRSEMAAAALTNSHAVVLRNWEEIMQFVNAYAAEHLILACRPARELAQQVQNAGSVFIGHYSPESAGDYASGTNHTLPTNGFARSYSGVSIDSFVKKITFQELSREGLAAIGPAVVAMAEAEGLAAHRNAITIRLNSAS